MNPSIGEQVSMLRKRAGLQQAELAKKAKISRNIISRIEVGKGNPTVKTLEAIGKALKLRVRIEFEELK
jgi:transcriptional regulator with XRE-family HTH domain